MLNKKKSYLVPLIGFAIIIIIGTLLLCLPVTNNNKISFMDSLFTAISAVTCTGLLTTTISVQFNFWGQLVLAILMEIGALGFIVFIAYAWSIRGKKFKMSDIIMINDNINSDNYNTVKGYSIFIFNLIVKIQLVGIVLLLFKLIPEFGITNGIWQSVFYTISAFSNTGFDLNVGNSLYSYRNDSYFQIILIILMVLGSVGIFAIEDLHKNKFRNFRKLKLQTKIILIYSFLLILIPTIIFKVLEPEISILNSLFMSSTPRSTGFSVVDLNYFTSASKILLIVLMLIGGSPTSTAGGVRIVPTAIILSTVVSTLKGKEETVMFWRKISDSTVRKSFTILIVFLVILVIAVSIFSCFNDSDVLDISFDSVSAITTTGLRTIKSEDMGLQENIILMLLMFIGRVGPLSIILAFVKNDEKGKYIEYPVENIIL